VGRAFVLPGICRYPLFLIFTLALSALSASDDAHALCLGTTDVTCSGASGGYYGTTPQQTVTVQPGLGTAMSITITRNLNFGVQYSGQYGGGVRDHAITRNLLWRF
jgi:hypothetical protein